MALGPSLTAYPRFAGIRTLPTARQPDTAVLVAGSCDALRAGDVPIVWMEHGVTAGYGTGHQAYPGGRGHARDRVVLHLEVNEYQATATRAAYPDVPLEVVGCPKLDRWHTAPPKIRSDPPTVAVSFHFDCGISPETRSTFRYYKRAVLFLARQPDVRLIGHAHPKAWARVSDWYRRARIEAVRDFDEVLALADVYAVDTSSTLYEFASLDRPVVVLNGPTYRRDVHHGLRFWDHADVGVNVDRPSELVPAVRRALEDPPDVQAARRAATEAAYPYRGDAADRAVAAIRRHLGGAS